jgi:putative ABC transport system permease protein
MMNKWLESFAYRIDIHPAIFILSGAFAVIIAFFTVSVHAVKAGLINPVNSLKAE